LEYVESDDDFFDQAGKVTKVADETPATYESLKREMQLLISQRDEIRIEMVNAQ